MCENIPNRRTPSQGEPANQSQATFQPRTINETSGERSPPFRYWFNGQELFPESKADRGSQSDR